MSFITVKFGNNQNMLFNPNCKTVVLLDDIKRRCRCNADTILDVSDERGEVKHLQDHGQEYANGLLKGRETLILLEVKTNKDTKEVTYAPLLKNMKKLYPQAMERLSNLTSNENDEEANHNHKHNTKLQKQRQTTQNTNNNLQAQPKSTKKMSVDHQRKRTRSERSQAST